MIAPFVYLIIFALDCMVVALTKCGPASLAGICLQELFLRKNVFTDFAQLKPLQQLRKLKVKWLYIYIYICKDADPLKTVFEIT